MNIREFLPTDGPGYTDYPEVDIRAHRKNARFLRLIGVGMLIVLFSGGVIFQNLQSLALAILVYLVCLQLSSEHRLEALEWEIELQRELVDFAAEDSVDLSQEVSE